MAKVAYDAIAERIGSSWTSVDGNALVVQDINKDEQPSADGTAFIALEFPLTSERQFTIGDPGNNFFKQECVFIIVINEERSKGTSRALGWADELAALYRGKIFSNVQCFEVSGPAINDKNDLGNYFQIRL